MVTKDWLRRYWQAVAAQDARAMRAYFYPQAEIYWHNTNERFTLDGFLRANCEYPGAWNGEMERAEIQEECAVTVAHVWMADGGPSFHVVSFFALQEGKISRIDEYWGDDGSAPQWRQDLRLGAPIR